jgi:lysyl-tRNA synthetase class 2
LLRHTAIALTGRATCLWQGAEVPLDAAWTKLTVAEAFGRYAGCTPEAAVQAGDFEERLVDRVEPQLATMGPVFLMDFPAELAALARLKANDPRVAERWELYVGGLELANAYSELVDPGEQRRRFHQAAERRRQAGREAYPVDERFLDAMAAGMPEMAGCALGVERLQMLLTGAEDIAQVRAIDEPVD